MSTGINPAVSNNVNTSAAALSQPNSDASTKANNSITSEAYFSNFATTKNGLGNSNTLNVNAGGTNPSASRYNLQLAQNSPQQQTQNGADRVGGIMGGVDLLTSGLNRLNISNDIKKVSNQIDQRIRENGAGSGSLVGITINRSTFLSPPTYKGMGIESARTQPPTGKSFDTVSPSNESTKYTWVSNTKPVDLPKNVGYMTPAQFRANADRP